MKEIGPVDHTLPTLTHFMVVRVAEGSSQLTLLAGVLAAVAAIAGLTAIFSSRLSRETAGTMLVLVCTVAFAAAFLLLAMTAIAISIGRAPVP